MRRTTLTRTLLAAGLAAGTSLTAPVLYAKRGGDLPGLTTEPVWTFEEGRIKPVAVTPGVSDGVYTEIAGAPLAEGAVVVTRASASPTAPATATQGSNPLIPSGPRPPR